MKNLLQKKLKTLFTVLLVLFTTTNLQAQTEHRHLWGTWELETIEITKQGVPEIHYLESLLADKENLPRNMFTQLYFFNDQVGVSSTEEIFVSGGNLNVKGSYTADDGVLIITMNNELPRMFTYIIENELLKIWYTQDNIELHLVYKLFKNRD